MDTEPFTLVYLSVQHPDHKFFFEKAFVATDHNIETGSYLTVFFRVQKIELGGASAQRNMCSGDVAGRVFSGTVSFLRLLIT